MKNVGVETPPQHHEMENNMLTTIEQKIEMEINFIDNLYEQHKGGRHNVKFLIALFQHEFELHPISDAHAERVISWIEMDKK